MGGVRARPVTRRSGADRRRVRDRPVRGHPGVVGLLSAQQPPELPERSELDDALFGWDTTPSPPVAPPPKAPPLDTASLEAALFGEGEGEPQVPVARRLDEATPADPVDAPGLARRVLLALGVLGLGFAITGAAYGFLGRDDTSRTPTVGVRGTSVIAPRQPSTTKGTTTTTTSPATTTAPVVVPERPVATDPPVTDPPVTDPPTITPTTTTITPTTTTAASVRTQTTSP